MAAVNSVDVAVFNISSVISNASGHFAVF